MAVVAPLLGNIALNLAIGVGASLLASAFAPKQATKSNLTTSKGFSFELQTGEAVPVSAVLGFGRAKGQLIYHNSYGKNNEYLQLVIKVGHGCHDGMAALLIDEKAVTLTGSNDDPKGKSVVEFTDGGTPYMWVKYYTGAEGQAADAELVARANPADRWTSAHKLTGCAYYILTCRYNADLFGSTIPLSGSVWRGLKVFDWRNGSCVWGTPSTYVFSTNPAVLRYNYRRGIYVNGVRVLGQGFSAFACDLPGYTAAANRCDEVFYDPVTDTDFTAFEYGREIGDDEAKLDVLAEFDAAYAGTSFKRGGADVPLPAQQLVSVLALNDSDRLRGYPVQVDRKGSVSAKKTMWHGQFVSAESAYGLAPYTPRIDTALETTIGGRRSVALDQPFEWLQPRAQMRAEIALRRQFYPATRVETFTPKAFVLEPGDPVTRVCEWGSMLMMVTKVSRVLVDGRLVGVTVTMQQWNNLIVPASGETFVTLPIEPGAGPADPDRTIAVSGFGIAPYSREGGGAVHPFGRATWTTITDPNVDQVMIRLWPSDGSEVDDKEDFFSDSKLTSAKLVGPLQPLTEYTYKAIPIRRDGRATVWTNTATFTTGAETTPAELADGSVTIVKLGQELQNAYGLVTDPSTGGSIPAQLLALRQAAEQLAEAVMTVADTVKQRLDILDVQRDGAAAAIILSQKAILTETEARAEAITEVVAQFGDALADGYLKLEAIANTVTAEVSISAKVKASMGEAVSQAAWILRASVTEDGDQADFAVLGKLYVLVPGGDGSFIPAIETLADGTVKFSGTRMGRIDSLDGLSYIDLSGGVDIYSEG